MSEMSVEDWIVKFYSVMEEGVVFENKYKWYKNVLILLWMYRKMNK